MSETYRHRPVKVDPVRNGLVICEKCLVRWPCLAAHEAAKLRPPSPQPPRERK